MAKFSFKPVFTFGIAVLWIVLVVQFGLGIEAIRNISLNHPISNLFITCNKFQQTIGDKNVVIRFDDVQAFGFKSVTTKIITDTLDKKIPLVLGVIPQFINQDKELDVFLLKNKCNLEIAVHGWDHIATYINNFRVAEFQDIDTERAVEKYRMGISIIKKTFKVTPVTFIPPENKISDAGKLALKKTHLTILSSDDKRLYDMTIPAKDEISEELIPTDTIIHSCKTLFETSNLCVIVVHPQDYTFDNGIDTAKYASYTELLTKLQEQGWNFTTFSEYSKNK